MSRAREWAENHDDTCVYCHEHATACLQEAFEAGRDSARSESGDQKRSRSVAACRFTCEELRAIREKARLEREEVPNHGWKRAFADLEHAAGVVDAFMARCEVGDVP